MTEYKIKKDIEMYLKMGLNNQYAVIVACVQNGVPDKAKEYLLEINEEQTELKKTIEDMVPFEVKSEHLQPLDYNLKNDSNI